MSGARPFGGGPAARGNNYRGWNFFVVLGGILISSLGPSAVVGQSVGSGAGSGSAPAPAAGKKPERPASFVPIPSTLESSGTPEPPPRDCVSRPTISKCDCKEMIAACQVQSDACMEQMARYLDQDPSDEGSVAQVDYENYMAKFDHPLLNTFLQKKMRSMRTTQRGSIRRNEERPEECQQCFGEYISQKALDYLGAERQHAVFLQKKIAPKEFGTRCFDENVDWAGMKSRGKCTGDEMAGLDGCLAIFWQCQRNKSKLEAAAAGKAEETKHIRAHPGEMPGFYR